MQMIYVTKNSTQKENYIYYTLNIFTFSSFCEPLLDVLAQAVIMRSGGIISVK